MHVGSRSFYRKYSPDNLYWRALKENPWIQEFCVHNPNVVLYGEIFGWVQSLKYGAKPGEIKFRAFDAWDNGVFFNWNDFVREIMLSGVPDSYWERIVPVLYQGTYNDEIVKSLMNGKSTLYEGHMREGVVLKPVIEMTSIRLGRIIMKAVSPEYLEKIK